MPQGLLVAAALLLRQLAGTVVELRGHLPRLFRRGIGRVVAEHRGMVTIRTIVGSERIVDMLVGEQLPRIC